MTSPVLQQNAVPPQPLAALFPRAAGGALGDMPVSHLTSDSRAVQPGGVFVAIKGTGRDGRDFAAGALAAGAVAVIGEGEAPAGVSAWVQVANARLALARAAGRLMPGQPATLVGVTGTNGKSSTVDFLRQIWTQAGHRAASLGTLGAIGPQGVLDLGHTTPDPVAIHATLHSLAAQGVTHAAMEASSHGLDQHRLDAVRLSAVGFLNLTQDHLDYHPTFAAYRVAKLRLFSDLAPRGVPAVVNADSPERAAFEAAAREAGLELLSVGWRGRDLKLVELMPRTVGQRLHLRWQGREFAVNLPLIGEFQALNAITSAALALALGDSVEAVVGGLEGLRGVKGRLELVGETATGAPVFVDYAHTPDGLDVLLRAARPHAAGRLFVVFGCGGDRDPYKRPLMGAIAHRHADVVIVTDDNPRSEEPDAIRAAILAAAPGALEIGDRAAAIRHAVGELKPGDALLIAGKGHETGQIIKGVVHPFSDQEVARAALEGTGGGTHG
jgi:UDP-N-acetylmuramoyl-L-alanyl-D-glutamate--2,6-diaminopimelate ligase